MLDLEDILKRIEDVKSFICELCVWFEKFYNEKESRENLILFDYLKYESLENYKKIDELKVVIEDYLRELDKNLKI